MKPFYFFIAILLLQACGGDTDEQTTTQLRPVRYGTISQSSGKDVHFYSGVAQASMETNLSFRVSGTIRNMAVDLGDRVRTGQLIATLDPVDYSIQAEQAAASQKGSEANLKSAETQLIVARANYYRVEKLYENNSVPLSEFEQAKSNFETAKASFEAAQTQVLSSNKQTQSAINQVNYTKLTAPFSGIITAVNAEENEIFPSGNPVAILSSESDPEVMVGIPENIISRIKNGMKVEVTFSVLTDQRFEGTIREISYAAGNSPTYPAIVRIDNPTNEIRPGMAANVIFNLGETAKDQPSYLVGPVQAIGEDENGNFVFVLEKADSTAYQAKKRKIEVGALLPDGFVIQHGLEEGELVATAGLKSLLDGMTVTLMQ
ncbi:MAG: efflux RND transporter periplasmic adaptor subunit [Bacteroidota bacterium]